MTSDVILAIITFWNFEISEITAYFVQNSHTNEYEIICSHHYYKQDAIRQLCQSDVRDLRQSELDFGAKATLGLFPILL